MSRQAELKENVLAAKLEILVRWAVEHSQVVLGSLAVVIIAVLAASVVIIKKQEARKSAATKMSLAIEALQRQNIPQAEKLLKEGTAENAGGDVDDQLVFFQGVVALEQKKFDDATHA